MPELWDPSAAEPQKRKKAKQAGNADPAAGREYEVNDELLFEILERLQVYNNDKDKGKKVTSTGIISN